MARRQHIRGGPGPRSLRARPCRRNHEIGNGWPVLGPYRTGFIWGFSVGMLRNTRVGYALYYVMVLWILFAGRPLSAAMVMAIYGGSQGLLLVIEVAGIARGILSLQDGLFG